MSKTAEISLFVGLVLSIASLGAGCASPRSSSRDQPSPSATTAPQTSLRDRWGIDITSIRMSGHGHLIDFRYRVLDPAKAATLGDRRYKPCMIDEATGTKLVVPNTPKLGPLRQSATRMEAGKIYFMLFANSGRLVKSGSRVTVAIGDFRVENLAVE
jgi:hypothetical protein